MRGAEMDDVIFGGSATRPSRNLAEATLVLDNKDRNAPSQFNDTDTIEVVRRIDRGRGSTYRVNGREVRAKDVHILFADAAAGARSPAIINQGRVGALISSKPSDRRACWKKPPGSAACMRAATRPSCACAPPKPICRASKTWSARSTTNWPD